MAARGAAARPPEVARNDVRAGAARPEAFAAGRPAAPPAASPPIAPASDRPTGDDSEAPHDLLAERLERLLRREALRHGIEVET
jgi:hypothetical protein